MIKCKTYIHLQTGIKQRKRNKYNASAYNFKKYLSGQMKKVTQIRNIIHIFLWNSVVPF